MAALTALAMAAFAGNSLLCRAALDHAAIDAASFTAIRVAAGALVLALIAPRGAGAAAGGSWRSAAALFAYAAGFSLAYESLPAATGALLLFGAVQATMIGRGLWLGERLGARAGAGLALAAAGLVALLRPGLAAPPLGGSLLMLGAGAAWGIYSLRGRGSGDPVRVTAGNFLRAVPLALALLVLDRGARRVDAEGAALAAVSGAVASGLGYAVWYRVLPSLRATQAASVQLSVPVLAALGGLVLLGEGVTPRFLAAAAAVLGGIALVILGPQRSRAETAAR